MYVDKEELASTDVNQKLSTEVSTALPFLSLQLASLIILYPNINPFHPVV